MLVFVEDVFLYVLCLPKVYSVCYMFAFEVVMGEAPHRLAADMGLNLFSNFEV